MQHRFVCQGTFGDRSGGINKNNKINQDFFFSFTLVVLLLYTTGSERFLYKRKRKPTFLCAPFKELYQHVSEGMCVKGSVFIHLSRV